ncbi:MAG: beta strand repeat-containing protein [Pseudolabrys sp.]
MADIYVSNSGSIYSSVGDGILVYDFTITNATIEIINSGLVNAPAGNGVEVKVTDLAYLGSVAITNTSTGVIAGGLDGVTISANVINPAATGDFSLDNAGAIYSSGTGNGVNFSALTSPNTHISITNAATGIIAAVNNDAILAGANDTIDNFGVIVGLSSGAAGSDGIDFQNNAGGVVENAAGGVIAGAEHGITGTQSLFVGNQGTIIGYAGSGINVETASTGGTTTIYNFAGGYIEGTSVNGQPSGDAINVNGIALIENFGTIAATGTSAGTLAEAISIGGGTILNAATGYIYSSQRAITIDGGGTADNTGLSAFSGATIYNYGAIVGSNGEAIVIVGNNADTIVNYGSITGSVSTGGGDDVCFLATGSSISGVLDCGAGNDTVDLIGAGVGTLASFANVETINVFSGDWTLGSEGVNLVMLDTPGETLRLTAGVLADGAFDGTISNFVSSDTIDLEGIGLASGAALGSGNLLTVSGAPGGPVALQLAAADNFTGDVFRVADDGAGGTLVTLDDAPNFTSPNAFSIAENGTAVGTVMATDPEHDAFTFSLSGGADASFFTVDSHSGALSFINAPDFESPADANGDNIYIVDVSATDAYGAVSTQDISVSVTNVAEPGMTINGGNGNQTITGSTGNDTIDAGNGNDTIYAGDGNDVVSGGNGDDVIYGGRGDDTVDGGNGNDMIDGGDGNNNLSGGNGDDTITAGSGNDVISGGNGNDTLSGGAGNDVLDGGNGNDRLAGGPGNDILTGGNGNDTFVFGANFGQDTVTDFHSGDHIEIDDHQFADFAAIQAASHQVGADVVITLDPGDTITLQHVQLSSLHASDFLLS